MSEPKITILADEADQPVVGRSAPRHNDLIREEWPDGARVTRRYWDASRFAEPPKPQDQTAGQVLDLMVARAGVAVVASCWRSDADEAVVWRGRMQLSVGRGISKTRAAVGFQALVSAGLLTAGQRAAILEAWPVSN